jgi:hypothetical protein
VDDCIGLALPKAAALAGIDERVVTSALAAADRDQVAAPIRGSNLVVSAVTAHPVTPLAAGYKIGVGPTPELVAPITALDLIRARAAGHPVPPGVAGETVGTVPAEQLVEPPGATDLIAAAAAEDLIAARTAVKTIDTRSPVDRVGPRATINERRVVAGTKLPKLKSVVSGAQAYGDVTGDWAEDANRGEHLTEW